MANEKVLNTKIQLKYDSYSNWVANNTALRAGEIAIAYLTTAEAVKPGEGDTQHPVLFKVGPGNFNDLPWASALAADVHNWAKKTESEFTAWVKTLVTVADIDAYSKDEVDAKFTANATADQEYAKNYADSLAENYDAAGTAQNLINDLDVADTAVTGQYVSTVSETDGKISVTRADLPTYTLATGSANGTVAFNGEDVAVKGLGSAAYTDSTAYDAAGAASEVNNALEAYKIFNDAAVSAADAKGAQGIADAAAALAKANEKTTMAEVEAKDYATKAEAQAMADGKDAAIEAAQKAGDDAQDAVDALAEKVGNVAEDKTVVEMIADAQAAATYDDTQVKADIKAIKDDYLTSVEEKALQDQITANANAIELLTNGVSAEEVDGVNDLIQYVKEHGTEVTGMKADIKANADAIAAIPQADWAQNDPEAKDYIKNRPFYETEGVVGDVFFEGTVDCNTEYNGAYGPENDITEGVEPLQLGQTYQVEIDGQVYITECKENRYPYIGEKTYTENSEYPFTIYTSYGGYEWILLIGVATPGVHTIKITSVEPGTLVQIDEKFIPDTIARVADVTADLGNLTDRVTTAEGKVSTLEGEMDEAQAAIIALEEKVGDKTVAEAIAEAVAVCKTDASNKDAVILAETQKGIDTVQGNLDTHADNDDIHVTAEKQGVWDAAVQTVTAGTGLKATKTGTDVTIDFDDEVVFIFDCGTSV